MTNAAAASRATAAMQRAYDGHQDVGGLTSWEMLDLMKHAVRVEFKQMTRAEFDNIHVLDEQNAGKE